MQSFILNLEWLVHTQREMEGSWDVIRKFDWQILERGLWLVQILSL